MNKVRSTLFFLAQLIGLNLVYSIVVYIITILVVSWYCCVYTHKGLVKFSEVHIRYPVSNTLNSVALEVQCVVELSTIYEL